MPSMPLLREKLRRPTVGGLCRPRVTAALDRIWSHHIGLVLAPAGSGKTTALAQYADQTAAEGIPVAWYRTDAADRSPATALRYVSTALTEALGLPATSTSLPHLVACLEQWPGPHALLVIDDLHASTAAGELLVQLAEVGPAYLRLVAAARREPAVNLSRIRLAGQLVEIDLADLRFRPWEVEQLFRQVYGAPLRPEDAARLTRHTAGWAAGLRLFHLATQDLPRDERHHAVDSLATQSRLVREYLTRTVIAELPADLSDLLVEACPLGQLSGPLCDAFLNRTGCAEQLAEIERREIFLTPLDHTGRYQLHDALRGHLEAVLMARIGEAAMRERYARAANLLEGVGAGAEAVRAYCRAEQWDRASHLIGADPGLGTGSDLTDLFPAEFIHEDPWLAWAHARQRLHRGDLAGALAAYRVAGQPFTAPGAAASYPVERAVTTIWLGGHSPVGPFHPGQHWSTSVRLATQGRTAQALVMARATPPPHGPLAVGLSLLLAGRLDAARDALARLRRSPIESGFVPLAAELGLRFLDLLRGNQREDLPYPTVRYTERHASPWLARICVALACAGSPAEISAIATDCAADADTWGEALVLLVGALGSRDRQPAQAMELAARAATRCQDLNARSLAQLARAVERACASSDQPPTAPSTSRWDTLLAAPAAASPPARVAEREPLLDICCLGSFRLSHHGRPLPLDQLRPRARQLLHLLAAHAGQVVHRDVIVDLLWTSSDLSAATHNLHVAVSSIRGIVGRGPDRHRILVRDGHGYRLAAPELATVDVQVLRSHIDTATNARRHGDAATEENSLRAIVDGYTGHLLPEDGPAEWVVELREQLCASAANAAEELAARLLDTDRGEEAIAVCEQGLRIDRYRDRLWRLILAAHERVGDTIGRARTGAQYAEVLTELAATGPSGRI